MVKVLKILTYLVLPIAIPMFVILLLMKILFTSPVWQIISVIPLWIYAIGLVESGVLRNFIRNLIDKNII